MGARGPQPTPTAIKEARGTARPDRSARNEAKPVGKPTCPSWLPKDAKREFRRLVKLLDELGLIGMIDGNLLTRYASTWHRWRQAVQMVERSGEVVPLKHEDGTLKYLQPNPYVSIARQLADQLHKMEAALGMSPSARSRIEVQLTTPQQDAGKGRFFNDGPPLKFTGT
jgi:P27 family predicted phage terminase small subunit